MQANSINEQIEQFTNEIEIQAAQPQTADYQAPVNVANIWAIFRGSPKPFKIALMIISLISFSTGLSLTVYTLAPDAVDLERQQVISQQFSVVHSQQAALENLR